LAAVLGKDIAKVYYDRPHTTSYYLGCSVAGRQGFTSAQRFPEDFDGIIAGAPALAFTNLTAWSARFYRLTGPPGSDSFLPYELWQLVHNEVLRQCDALDGVRDGIIEDPADCEFNALSLLCGTTESQLCLTRPQVQTVERIFSDYRGKDNALIYPRMQPGSEIIAAMVYYNGQPFHDV